MPIQIRWMMHCDIAGVHQVMLECQNIKGTVTEADIDDFLKPPTNSGLVAEEDNEVIGYVLFQIDPVKHIARIVTMAVSPPWQREGIGSRLLQEVMGRQK